MKSNRERLAPLGLALALLAALAAGGLYIVRKQFDLWQQISLGMILVGLAVYVLLDPERVRKTLTGRQARYGSNALVMTLAFTGILVVVNYLANQHSVRWDLTADQEHSLSQQTLEVLDSLQQDVSADAYFTAAYPSDTARNLLESYQYASQGRLTYAFIDPDQNPVAAQQAGVTRDGTIVFKAGDLQEQITYASEQEITSALIKLNNPGERVVYFLTGHGEYDPTGSATDTSYALLAGDLEKKNYTVNTLNLVASPVVPQDALAVIVAGPRLAISAEEVALLKAYVASGGSLVVLSEPRLLTELGEQPDLLGDYLKTDWGIELSESVVFDPSISPPSMTVASYYSDHSITQKLMNMVTVFPTTRALLHGEAAQGVTLTDLIQTADSAWAETDYDSITNNQINADEQVDIMGPLTIAVAAEKTETGSRLVVVGDADFAGDASYSQYGNSDLALNIVDWAAAQDNLLNLAAKETTERMMLSPQNISLGLILLVSVFLIPGLVLAFGVLTWVDRRRRG